MRRVVCIPSGWDLRYLLAPREYEAQTEELDLRETTVLAHPEWHQAPCIRFIPRELRSLSLFLCWRNKYAARSMRVITHVTYPFRVSLRIREREKTDPPETGLGNSFIL